MAKLKRVTAKIFAENATEGKIGQFGSAKLGNKVNTSDVEEIQALEAYRKGWEAAIVSDNNYPTMQEMNGVLKNLSYQNAYLLQNGVPEWDINTEYYINNWCKIGSILYESLINNNIGNLITDTTKWKKIELGGANIDLANLSVDGEKRFDNKADVDLLNTAPGQAFKNESMSWIMPDYTKGINKVVGVAHTADKNGWIVVRGLLNSYGTASRFKINGEMVVYTAVGDGGGDSFIPAPVAKGDTYILVEGTSIIFYPAKGEI